MHIINSFNRICALWKSIGKFFQDIMYDRDYNGYRDVVGEWSTEEIVKMAEMHCRMTYIDISKVIDDERGYDEDCNAESDLSVPIVVLSVDNMYHVIDGCLRIKMARQSQIQFIRAFVVTSDDLND